MFLGVKKGKLFSIQFYHLYMTMFDLHSVSMSNVHGWLFVEIVCVSEKTIEMSRESCIQVIIQDYSGRIAKSLKAVRRRSKAKEPLSSSLLTCLEQGTSVYTGISNKWTQECFRACLAHGQLGNVPTGKFPGLLL